MERRRDLMNEVLCENISDGLLACYLQKDNSSGLEAFASKITSKNESLLLDENDNFFVKMTQKQSDYVPSHAVL